MKTATIETDVLTILNPVSMTPSIEQKIRAYTKSKGYCEVEHILVREIIFKLADIVVEDYKMKIMKSQKLKEAA